MNEGGNCPMGSSLDKNAPWNIDDMPEAEFDVTCSQTLSKTVKIFTNNYISQGSVELDEEGNKVFDRWNDTSNTDWSNEYHINDHYTPLQLIELFQKYLLDEVNGSCTTNKTNTYLNWLISECNHWTEDETEYIEA